MKRDIDRLMAERNLDAAVVRGSTQVSGAAFTWSTTLVNSLPLACGDKNNNNCEGLATNVP